MDSPIKKTGYASLALFTIIGFTVIRYYISGCFLLTPDETNYWQWGRHLALGYHDQAPMIGWLINLSTRYLGHTEQAVRLPSVIMGSIASFYMIVLCIKWFGSRIAFHTAILSQGVLIFFIGGVLATADAIQAAGWAGAAYHVAMAYEKDDWGSWLLGGFWFGIGILGKFSMGIFLPCAFLFGLFTKEYRSRLAGIKPYAGVSIGLLMLSPAIIWNAMNGWNSIRHVAYLGGANEKAATVHIGLFLEYLGSEALLLTPVVFLLCVAAWWKSMAGKKHRQNLRIRYLLFTSFPMFAFFMILSLHTRVYGNWPAPAYLTACILIALFFHPEIKKADIETPDKLDTVSDAKEEALTDDQKILMDQQTDIPVQEDKASATSSQTKTDEKPYRRILRHRTNRDIWHFALVTAYLITTLVVVQTAWRLLPLPGKLDRTARETTGWKELGANVDAILKTMPSPENTFISGFRYQIASELAFYTPGQPETVSINRWNRPNVYDYWSNDESLKNKDAVVVTDRDPQTYFSRLCTIFEKVDQPVEINTIVNGKEIQKFHIFRAYGFKGGLRWEPTDKSDVRAGKPT